ncbi:MAG: ATP-binding protein [Lachnospiraceae bacterium]|nr:ATP-binding protein [Lachnospiraceae bacterium]
MGNLDELILYRGFENGQILEDMEWVLGHRNSAENHEEIRNRFFSCMHALIDLAGTYGFEGNLWHDYLTLILVNHENVFSTSCEICGMTDGSLRNFARHDFMIFMQLFALDFDGIEQDLNVSFFEEILHYQRGSAEGKVFNRRIRDRICELSAQLAADAGVGREKSQSTENSVQNAEDLKDAEASADDRVGQKDSQTEAPADTRPERVSGDLEQFTEHMIRFYQEYGVGKFGLHKAFRIQHDESGVQILPITNIAHVKLDDLVGYEIQKKKLIDNTEAFIQGKKANNCLLFGDAGTGKSSSIKGILNQYYDRGLRMIEIYKHQFQDLNEVIAQIKNRNYRFIIYMDDLSFEEFEVEYKYLKAVIEGGLERKPENVLIYATSNRRHLIREQFADNMEGDIGRPAELHATHGGDLHVSDTVQEKLSLSSRFGVTIYFGSPDKKQFQNIVRTLAARYGITMPEEELLLEANKWELSHGGLSGRTATQFVDYLSACQPYSI